MKKIQLICLLCIITFHYAFSQNVGIGTTTPDASAILDLRSTTKGLLIPRMTYAQRMAIPGPASGLIVYQTDDDPTNELTPGFYVRTSGTWRKIYAPSTPPDATWSRNTSDNTLQYSLTQKIGIGVIAPTHLMHLRSTTSGHVLLEGDLPIINFRTLENSGYQNAGRIYGSGRDMVVGTGLGNGTGRVVFEVGGGDRAFIDPDGTFKTASDIHLTNSTFTTRAFLQANNFDFRLGTVSGNTTGNIIFRANGADAVKINPAGDLVPLNNIQFLDGTTEKAFIQRSGDDLRLGTNSGNNLGNVIVRMNGANRFQFAESGRFTIFADQSPTLYFNTDNSNKAYIQLFGENLKIDAPGNKLFLGDDMTVDDATNRVGIGTATPEQKLHVIGNVKASTGKVLNASDENLLPIAFGTFGSDAYKISGTANISSGWIGTDCYLECAGVDISKATIIITCRNARLMPSWVPDGTRIRINFYDTDGDERGPVGYSVVVYKTN